MYNFVMNHPKLAVFIFVCLLGIDIWCMLTGITGKFLDDHEKFTNILFFSFFILILFCLYKMLTGDL